MARYKVIYLLLLTFTISVSPEEAPKLEDRTISLLKPPDKIHLSKSTPYKKADQSWMSKVANWIFPYGNSEDSLPAEGRHAGVQYLPPRRPSHQHQNEGPGCNPCNQEPWVPIYNNLGHKTVINFVPPASQAGYPQKFAGPPVTHLRPVSFAPFGMVPPPLRGESYHSLPSSGNYAPPRGYLPVPPQPSESYSTPSGSRHNHHVPIPFPNLNSRPTLPIYEQHDFHDNAPHEGVKYEYRAHPNLNPLPTLPIREQHNFRDDNAQYEYRAQPLPLPNLNPFPTVPIHGQQDFNDNTPHEGVKYEYRAHPQPLPNLNPFPTVPIHGQQDFNDNTPYEGVNYEYREHPQPVPNLNPRPGLPIHNHQNFHENSVQVIPSLKVADFLSSIEHPINVIQSPLVEVSVKNTSPDEQTDIKPGGYYGESGRLNENPIIVEDTHAAASANNATFQESNGVPRGTDFFDTNQLKQLLLQQPENKTLFTPPPVDYSKWEPTWSESVDTSMVPPPPAPPTTWLYPVSTTKKTKQIIVPYITNKTPLPFSPQPGRKVPARYTTLVPLNTPPASTSESLWTKFAEDFKQAESNKITATAFTPAPTQVYNIRDILKNTREYYPLEKLPFDVISLQNHIDNWTQQEYSKTKKHEPISSKTRFAASKNIPNEYFSTDSTTISPDYEPASSNQKETRLEDIESNLVLGETTTDGTTTVAVKDKKSLWDSNSVTVSPITKEKIFVVTPQPVGVSSTTPVTAWSHPPQIQNGKNKTNPTPRFLIRVDPESSESREKLKESFNPLTVVFSEWPHLINNLQVTTTTIRSTSKHPLLGLMGLTSYTPPANSTVQTITGHSKVYTVVTASSVS